jgi:hypothetical protein
LVVNFEEKGKALRGNYCFYVAVQGKAELGRGKVADLSEALG